MPASAPSLRWLTLAVLLPLILLAVLAALGTRAQFRAAWEQARREAERIAPAKAAEVARTLEEKTVTAPLYPDPPAPGPPSAADAVLDGSDIPALLALRDNPDAGLSPSGLPRRALAALRVLELDRSAQEAPLLVSLLTREAPSILTGRALERLDAPPAVLDAWQESETFRDLLRRHPQTGKDGLWLSLTDRPAWVAREDGSMRYLPPSAVTAALENAARDLPPWATLEIPGAPTPLAFEASAKQARRQPPDPAHNVTLAAFGPGIGGLLLEVRAAPYLVEAAARRQQIWTFSLLAVAVGISAAGLLFLHRTLRRERQLHEMKSQFVASVSHELRAPVASIRLMADALEAEKVDPPTARKFHRLIAREGARLSTLVANVLDHARIERGSREWRMEPCYLVPLVEDTLRVMEPLAAEKNIAFATDLAPIEATVDAGAIQQALVNLLDNAIKFPPPGSTVHISLTPGEDRRTWSLTVRDEGPGIPRGEHGRIFERFYRPGDELRRETQGAGIGLSLVKSIAEAHRGEVLLDSEPGRGSAFTLRLPLSP